MRTLMTQIIRAPGTAAVHLVVGLLALLLLWAAISPTGIPAAAFLAILTLLGVLDLLGCTVITGLLRLWGRWTR